MAARRGYLLGVVFVTLLMVVGSLGLLGGLAAAPATSSGVAAVSHASPAAAPVGPRTAPGLPSALNPSGITTAENPLAITALHQAAAAGVPSRDVFIPRAGATPAQMAQAAAQGHVTPLYGQDTPAPLGLAYYGLSAAPNGSIVASTLNTPRVFATFDPNATGVVSNYPFSSSTDMYGVQLNAVTTSINLLGNDSYSFWTQNVAEFSPLTSTLYLVTNVWNFTGGAFSSNALYSHGPYGTQVGTTFYYSEKILQHVSYPFKLDLWMNNSVTSGRNNVSFTVGLAQGTNFTNYTSYPYDWVDFNSNNAVASNYTASGSTYNALHLTNDFEVIIGGPGGGSQANLFAADANMSLQYWNTTTGSFRAVPAAYSYGGETGETATGANVRWVTNATGQPYGVVSGGPGFLYGLWNATTSSGTSKVTFSVSPSNAFIFMAINQSSNFSYESELYWAPQEVNGGTFYLAPGHYNISFALSGYDPYSYSFVAVAGGVSGYSVSLTANSTIGIYTPIYVWNNNQFADVSTSGNGTPGNPYHLFDTQTYLMSALFGFFNDYTFPVYNSVFLWGTTASVVLSNMPGMVTSMPYLYFPTTNELGYLFEGASNVALVNSTHISGWFTSNVNDAFVNNGQPFNGNYYGTFSVQMWNTTDSLIANDTFETQAAGLSMQGGTGNTVWGNTFEMVPQPTFASLVLKAGITPLNLSLGLQATESGDSIYNNYFATTNTAVAPPYNLYTGAFQTNLESWNITPTAASTVHHASGFPWFPLTGTIIHNGTQGGNFWWDYGSANNPLHHLPYKEYNATLGYDQIYYGGDDYPLVATNYSVTFSESGLASGTSWSVDFGGTTRASQTSTLTFAATNGSYVYSIPSVGSLVASPSHGTVTVAGVALTVDVSFAPPPVYAVSFTETGLPAGTTWTLTVGTHSASSNTATIAVDLSNGSYAFSVSPAVGYTPTPANGTVAVSGAPVTVSIVFLPPPTYAVTFTETGLASGTNWSVTFNGVVGSSTTSTISFTVPDNSYLYSVGAVAGYAANPSSGTVTVRGAAVNVAIAFASTGPATYAVTFTESGLPTGTNWSVAIAHGPTLFGTSASLTTHLANATYSYTVGNVTGYVSSQPTGTVTVSGGPQSVSVTFAPVPTTGYVNFVELGLPVGTNWSVSLNGVTHYSTSAFINFTVPFGTYRYAIANVSGYTYAISSLSPASPITLSATNAVVGVGILYTQSSTTTSSSGLSMLDWYLIAAVVVIVIVGIIAALAMRRRGGSKPATNAPAAGTTTPPSTEGAPDGETTYGSGGKAA